MALLDITVAKVAAMISAGVTIISFTYALSLGVILVYLMRNDNSPSTWSVFVRNLHFSSWSVLLSTNVSNTTHADKPIKRIDIVSKIAMILVVFTGVITPLGLEPTTSQIPIDSVIHSLTDSQSLSLATTSRAQYVEERFCLTTTSIDPSAYQEACPGRTLTNVTGLPALQTDLSIPQNITTIFSSSNYASPFDMQYRRFVMSTNDLNVSTPHPNPDIRISESIILSDSLFAVSGLIIDTTGSPGVGLANVQVPYLPHGGTWNQSMLWIEPETACQDLEFTVDFQMDEDTHTTTGLNQYITDQGGFTNFNYTAPTIGNDGQHVSVKDRASALVNMLNAFMIDSYNITRNSSYIGKKFAITGGVKFNLMEIVSYSAEQVDIFIPLWSPSKFDTEISDSIACNGFGGLDHINTTKTAVECFIFIGAPKRTDGGDSMLWEANSTWTRPAFACASTVRAKMQTLTVSSNSNINETTTLSSLKLQRQDANTPLLWALESGMAIGQMDPYWGPIADLYEDNESLMTLRSEVFYLPAGLATFQLWNPTTDASSLPSIALELSTTGATNTYGTKIYDYTGGTNVAMLQLWRNLSASADTVSRITNLIWTDIMANNLYSNVSVQSTTVMKNVPTVGYNLLYAIPAFISLALWIVLMVITTAFFARDRTSLHTIRQALYQTSLGRVVVNIATTSAYYAENTKNWISQESSNNIGLNITKNNKSEHIQFDLVPEKSRLWQMLGNSENSIKRRKQAPQVSDPSELYPLDQESDKE
ncbi:hypothetical protein VKS41_007863 [Umbelopsis sp. WA50703]